MGWNFLFVGATTLLTETYRLEERAKTQAINDFLVLAAVSIAVLFAGSLEFHLGWQAVNLSAVPLILIILAAIIWLLRREAARPAATVGDEPEQLKGLE